MVRAFMKVFDKWLSERSVAEPQSTKMGQQSELYKGWKRDQASA